MILLNNDIIVGTENNILCLLYCLGQHDQHYYCPLYSYFQRISHQIVAKVAFNKVTAHKRAPQALFTVGLTTKRTQVARQCNVEAAASTTTTSTSSTSANTAAIAVKGFSQLQHSFVYVN